MSKLRVEQLPDKTVNVFFRNLHFKLSLNGHHSRLEWSRWTEHGFEPVSEGKVLSWLNRIWVEKVHCAAHPPRIPRFPRLANQRVMDLLASAKKANRQGRMGTLAKISDQIKSIASTEPGKSHVAGWKDIPLASEAPEQDLKWLAQASHSLETGECNRRCQRHVQKHAHAIAGEGCNNKWSISRPPCQTASRSLPQS